MCELDHYTLSKRTWQVQRQKEISGPKPGPRMADGGWILYCGRVVAVPEKSILARAMKRRLNEESYAHEGPPTCGGD